MPSKIKILDGEFRETMSDMINSAEAAKGPSFAAAARFALTMNQILRMHAMLCATARKSEVMDDEEADLQSQIFCTLMHDLFSTFINESPIAAEDVDEALEYGRTLFDQIEAFEDRINDK